MTAHETDESTDENVDSSLCVPTWIWTWIWSERLYFFLYTLWITASIQLVASLHLIRYMGGGELVFKAQPSYSTVTLLDRAKLRGSIQLSCSLSKSLQRNVFDLSVIWNHEVLTSVRDIFSLVCNFVCCASQLECKCRRKGQVTIVEKVFPDFYNACIWVGTRTRIEITLIIIISIFISVFQNRVNSKFDRERHI